MSNNRDRLGRRQGACRDIHVSCYLYIYLPDLYLSAGLALAPGQVDHTLNLGLLYLLPVAGALQHAQHGSIKFAHNVLDLGTGKE